MDHVSLRARHKQVVTQRIIAAAKLLFAAQGFDRTTMDDIAGIAEISRATLFNYFPSKEALLFPWGREMLEQEVLPQVMAYLSTRPTTMQALQMLLVRTGEYIQAFPDVARAFVGEASKSCDQARSGVDELGVLEIHSKVLHYGQERGDVRTDIPVEHMAGYLLALETSLFFPLLGKDVLGDVQQEMSRLLAFIAGGLAPTPATQQERGEPA